MTSTLRLPGRYYRLYPTIAEPLGHAEEHLELDPAETVLLIVDVYGLGFGDEADSGDVPGLYAVDPVMRDIVRNRIRPVKDAAKRAGLKVVYLTNHLSPGLNEGNEWRNLSIRTVDVDVLDAWREPNDILAHAKVIAPDPDDVVIPKQYYSGFHGTTLDLCLRGLGARNLVMVGFDSRICLGNTTTDALYHNYRVVVLRDCVRTLEYPETREGEWANFIAIRYIETNTGYTSTADDWIAACDTLGDAAAGTDA
jgi:nicotinamidase-related amidase